MTQQFYQNVVVPVANTEDAVATTNALVPYFEGRDGTVTAVHVIEKADGGLDKASVEQRERIVNEIFTHVTDGLADLPVTVDTEVHYSTDVAATVIEFAHDKDAGAILFTPRGGSRWEKLLSGDVSHKLVKTSDVPVLVLPDTGDSEA